MADNGGFTLVASCNIGGVPALKYRSLRTGIVVCIAQIEGPLVSGFFCLGTQYVIISHIILISSLCVI